MNNFTFEKIIKSKKTTFIKLDKLKIYKSNFGNKTAKRIKKVQL